jgi:hypothetical protein
MAESVQIVSVSHKHAAFADAMLADPTKTKTQLAKEFGVSLSWFSIVTNSDAFREYFDQRRKDHDKELREQITRAQLNLSLKTYAQLETAVEAVDVKPEFLLNTAEHTMKALGYEPRKTGRIIEERTLETSQPVDAGLLADARARMTRKVTHVIEQDAPSAA